MRDAATDKIAGAIKCGGLANIKSVRIQDVLLKTLVEDIVACSYNVLHKNIMLLIVVRRVPLPYRELRDAHRTQSASPT